ncbi:hypothetical protein A9Q99_11415 [Gammaproteobacteria bacterium 45_16_T64]|nr:hypothetical protein A9Q99_11415 [Gammaproteobacteria bacterium 45_16_T64]
MKKSIVSVFVCCLAALTAEVNAAEPLYPANVTSLFEEPGRLVVLWSVDCPPCFDELAMLEKLLKQYPELPVTFVSTDDDSERYEEVDSTYRRFAGNTKAWVFGDGMAAALRYAIDPAWSGVLPRSYFVDREGERHGHSGVLKEAQVISLFQLSDLPSGKGKGSTGH